MMKVSSLTIAVALCAVFLICNAAEEAADKRGAGTRTFAFAKRPSFAFAKRFPSRAFAFAKRDGADVDEDIVDGDAELDKRSPYKFAFAKKWDSRQFAFAKRNPYRSFAFAKRSDDA